MAHPHSKSSHSPPEPSLHQPGPHESAYAPIFDTRTGRLAELVHLLADVPLDRAVNEIEQPTDTPVDDPLWTVAGALVRLRSAREAADLVLV